MSLSLVFEDASLFSPVAQLLLSELDAQTSSSQSVLDDFILGDYQLLIARKHGDAIGCISYRLLDDKQLDVRCLYVRASYRDLGVATALLSQLAERVQLATDKEWPMQSQHFMVEQLIHSLGLQGPLEAVPHSARLKSVLLPIPRVGNLQIL